MLLENVMLVVGILLLLTYARGCYIAFVKNGWEGPFTQALCAIAGYASDSSLSRRLWSEKTVYEARNRDFFMLHGFTAPASGTSADPFKDEAAPIMTYDDLSKGEKGDKIRVPWLDQLSAAGVTGTTTLEGQEEALAFGYLDIIVDQLRHASGFLGKVAAIRNPALRTKTIKKLLVDWKIEKREYSMFYTMYHGASPHCVTLTHYTATAHPNTYYHRGLANAAALDTIHKMDTTVLDYGILAYQNSAQPIPFPKVGGMSGGIVLMHDVQLESLLNDNKFWNLQKDANARRALSSKKDSHPLFADADYIYRGLYIYASNRIFKGTDLDAAIQGDLSANDYGAIFLGARAVGCANGGFPEGLEGMRDGMGFDSKGNVQYLVVPSDTTDYREKEKWSIASIWCDRRADYTMDATGTKNNSSFVIWTRETASAF